jgi:hypothetical protein
VNLIKRLLSRRHETENIEGASSVNWPGQSGKEYPYQVYPLDTSFQSVPANYIYAKQSESGYWVPIYIAQTRNLNQRLEDYEKQGRAIQDGATHILVHISNGGHADRCSEERDLILCWKPPCNDPVGD